jgi:O-antigen/teichoic acid export membrane protein
VQDRPDVLMESFEKSNRLALVWATPFGLAFTLFAPDLVHLGLGEEWEPAIVVLQLIGISAVINQIGFNWTAYYRGRGETRPLAVASCVSLAAFAAIVVPLTIVEGLPGYSAGLVVMALIGAQVRGHYLRRIFPGLRVATHALRAMAPTVPAVAAVLAVRLAEDGERTVPLAVGELTLFAVLTIAASARFERRLLREIIGYLGRARPETASEPEALPS